MPQRKIVPNSQGPSAISGPFVVGSLITRTPDRTVAYWTNNTYRLGPGGKQITLKVMVYTGAGAPSSTTLTAGTTYQVGNFYQDTSGNVLYLCVTQGDLNTSGWIAVTLLTGSGAPGASTLPGGNVTFVVGNTYYNLTLNHWSVCTTKGSATTSVWTQVI